MSDRTAGSPADRPALGPLFGGLYVELCILVFCAAILSQTGQTKGPVFDVVGPDFLPTTVAWIVAVLTALQVVVHLVGWRRGQAPAAPTGETAAGWLIAVVFGGLTVVYAGVLSNELAPFYLATAVYLLACTVLLARRLSWKDVAGGAVLGILMGVGLQLLFTRVFVIDLPV